MKKPEILYRQLRKFLETQPLGARLPSIRKLITQYKTSLVVITEALDRLKAEGELVSRPYDGIYKARANGLGNNFIGQIGLFIESNLTGNINERLIGSVTRTFSKLGFSVVIREYKRDKHAIPIWDDKSVRLDAVLLFYPTNFFTSASISALKNSPFPVILMDSTPLEICINCVGSDNEYGGAMAADWLLRSGCKKLSIINVEPFVSTVKNRIRGFLHYAKLQNAQSIGLFNNSTYAEREIFEHYFSECHPHLILEGLHDGIFCTSLSALRRLKSFLSENEISALPEDAKLVVFDEDNKLLSDFPGCAHILQDFDAWAETAAQILRTMPIMDEGEVQHHMIPPKLIW